MKSRLAFALFAAAILFSIVREWRAPVGCLRIGLHDAPAVAAEQSH
jgi:hypothetical protein